LFLAAVPTAILLFVFYFILRWAFFQPLLQVMAKREALIEGSRKEAESTAVETQEKQRTYSGERSDSQRSEILRKRRQLRYHSGYLRAQAG
jgi:F0F1-type ATP synthase membrane subunit b/b'